MLNHLLDLIRSNTKENSYNTDSVDKFNSRYCAITLLVLATFVITNQLVGDVIDCWTEAQFSGQWVKYTDQMCWVSNTYHLPTHITPEAGRNSDHIYEIKYYQWVPIILAMQALLFFLPSLVWSAAADSSIDISNIVSALNDKSLVLEPEKRDKSVKNVALQFHRYIKNRRQYSHSNLNEVRRKMRETNSFCLACGSRYGNYLGLVYLLAKALFVFNSWAQLFCLDSFLGPKFHAYGFDVLQSMYEGVDWTNSQRFPRVTLCDFEIRKMGTIQPVTVQCVLSINLFNERIFLFVWFMVMFMAVINTANFALWLWRIILRKNRYNYIRKHLTLMEKITSTKTLASAGNFVDRYLQHDGVFVVRLMSKNATSLVISEMVAALFDTYMENGGKSPAEDSLLASPKGSSTGLSSRKGSLHRSNAGRKGSQPPAYNYNPYRHVPYSHKVDCVVRDIDDLPSGASSENGAHYPPINQSDDAITAEELACIRRMLRSEKNPPVSNGPPTAPPLTAVANLYTAAPTLASNSYPLFAHEDPNFDPDNHPKAREASQPGTTQC